MTQKNHWIARQGDVLLMEVDAVPAEAMAHKRQTDQNRVILAYGEVTGHAHALDPVYATAYGPSDDAFWLTTEPGATVTHEEHAPIIVPEHVKAVRVIRQREYSAAGERRVAD